MDEMEVRRPETVPAAEETRGGITFVPDVDIYETDEELVVMADMPGVAKDSVDINLEEDQLLISGQTAPVMGEGESQVVAEFQSGRYARRFALSNVIDQSGIKAQLSDGVLKVTLPKVKQAKPRKIEVQMG